MVSLYLFLLLCLNICFATGNPLLLTPLIKNGKINEAQDQARVTHPLFLEIASYSGYLTSMMKSQIFFWYIPAENNPNAPLVVLCAGGLGESSLVGLFLQFGPYIPSTPDYLTLREHSLHKRINLLILDAPAGVGFSLSTEINRTSSNAVENYYEALMQLYALFPTMATQDFYIAGELFGSNSIVRFGSLIHTNKYRKNQSNAQKTRNAKLPDTLSGIISNLKGFVIYRGIFDLKKQINFGDYWYQTGIIDENQRSNLKQEQSKLLNYINTGNYKMAYNTLNDVILNSNDITRNTLFINFTGASQIADSTDFANRTLINNMIIFLNKDEVQNALHTSSVQFMEYSSDVRNMLAVDAADDLTDLIKQLVPHYKFLSVNLQMDPLTPAVFMDEYWNTVNISELQHYSITKKQLFKLNEGLVGHYKNVGNLWQIFVRHDVTQQQSWNSEIIYKFVNSMSFV